MFTAPELAKLIKEDVEWLIEQDGGCCTHKLDERLAVCVGWSDGYATDDETVIHSPTQPKYCINAAIKVWTSDDMRTDLDWLNMPYYFGGEVWNTQVPISPNENFKATAKSLLHKYEELSKYSIDKYGLILELKEEEKKRRSNPPLFHNFKLKGETKMSDNMNDFGKVLLAANENLKALKALTKETNTSIKRLEDNKWKPVLDFWKNCYSIAEAANVEHDLIVKLPFVYGEGHVHVSVSLIGYEFPELGFYKGPREAGGGNFMRWITLDYSYERTLKSAAENPIIKSFLEVMCENWNELQPVIEKNFKEAATTAMAKKLEKAEQEYSQAQSKLNNL